MKLNKFMKFLSVVISLSFLSVASISNTAEADVNITVWKASDEAKSLRDKFKHFKKINSLDKNKVPEKIEELRKNYSIDFPKVKLKNSLSCKKYGDNPIYVLKNGKKRDLAIVFLHPGGFYMGINNNYAVFCDRCVDALDADAIIPLYSRIPYGTYKEAFQLLDAVYADLQKDYKKVIIAGASAGGNLAFAYTLHRKDKKMELPYKLIGLSPCADLEMSNPDILKYADRDPMTPYDGNIDIMAYWKGDLDIKNWKVSPLYGDLTGLPDILLFYAEDDIAYPDEILFYNALQKAGNNTKLIIGSELYHVFPTFDIPEQKKAIETMKEFCK